MNTKYRQNIAVIGSGISGLSATHFLQKEHSITLFEKNDKLGGHTNTYIIKSGPDEGVAIDTGFIVMNSKNYPVLTKLFEEINIETQVSNMSFSYYDVKSNLQYCGNGLSGMFSQKKNLFDIQFYRMIKDIIRFNQQATKDVNNDKIMDNSLGQYLENYKFSKKFIEHHIVPMGSAIWSTPCEKMMNFPVKNFINFFNNHGLLSFKERPIWKVVKGGSYNYINSMMSMWKDVKIKLNAKIFKIKRYEDKVEIIANDKTYFFDQVIIATHANQVLSLITDPSLEEIKVFNEWQYSSSKTYLHSDSSIMPPLKKIWSSWNFQRYENMQTNLTYYMNKLQKISSNINYFVSLGLDTSPKNIIYETTYEHPIFTNQVIENRSIIQKINGNNRTWYTGSYLGNGFHEDGICASRNLVNIFNK